MELKGRVALVTGGATGIGRATVLQLARSGVAGVAINYRTSKQDAENLAAEVVQIGSNAICVNAGATALTRTFGANAMAKARVR